MEKLIKRALLGDHEAAKRLADAGVLLGCPYCKSNQVRIDYKQITVGINGLDMPVKRYTYSGRCNKCHARGPSVGGRVVIGLGKMDGIKRPSWATSTKELEYRARLAWNTRAPVLSESEMEVLDEH